MKALIIGIHSHLGNQTAINLAKKGFILYGTTRKKSFLKSKNKNIFYYPLDLIDSKEQEFQGVFEQGPFDVILHYASPYDVNTKQEFQGVFEQGPFDVILHYASPYDVNTKLDDVSKQLRKDFYQCMNHDQLILNLAYNNLKKNGSLIVSGAIIAEDIFIGQSGMSGIHKANLKRIAAEYHHLSINQNKPIHIKYLNLGSFKDKITQIEDGMPIDEVVAKISHIIDNPKQFDHKIDIMTPFEANKYGF